jgi:hypothetical protein
VAPEPWPVDSGAARISTPEPGGTPSSSFEPLPLREPGREFEAVSVSETRHRLASNTWPGTAHPGRAQPPSAVELPPRWPDLPDREPLEGDEGRIATRAILRMDEHERRLDREQRG